MLRPLYHNYAVGSNGNEFCSGTFDAHFLIRATPGPFSIIFVLSSFHLQIHFRFQQNKLKKRGLCAWNLNPRPQGAWYPSHPNHLSVN